MPIETPVDLDDFSIDQIETGPPFDWKPVAIAEDAFPHTLLEHRDQLYVFASSAEGGAAPPSGLQAWRSDNGVAWNFLGTVISEDHQISSIASTEVGLIAVATNDSDERIHLWGSVDGIAWSEIVDSIPVGDDPITSFQSSAVFADDEMVVVAGSTALDGLRLFEQHFRDTTRTEVDLSGLTVGWEHVGGDLTMVVRGPLGILAHQIPASDLGLTQEQTDWISGYIGGQGDRAVVWTTRMNGDWESAEIEGAFWLTSLTTGPEGELIAFGYGNTTGAWRSSDGVNWEPESNEAGDLYLAEPWADGFIGFGYTGSGEDVLVSERGDAWEPAGLSALFPRGLGWYSSGLGTGKGGIAVVAEIWLEGSPPFDSGRSTIEKDGFTVTVNHESGNVTLESDDHRRSWGMWSSQPPDDVEIDIPTRSITFHDPESGETLVSFTMDELRDLELRARVFELEGNVVFSFSTDAETWSLQDMGDEIGESARVLDLEVTDERVVALVADRDEWLGGFATIGFEIWSAEIPDAGSLESGTSR